MELLDRLVRLAPQYGLKVMVDLAFWAPQWASRGVPTRGHVDVNVRDFSLFAYAMAERYNGTYVSDGEAAPLPRVSIFTVSNEPSEIGFWGPMWKRVSGDRLRARGAAPLPRARRLRLRRDQGGPAGLEGARRRALLPRRQPDVNGDGSMPPLPHRLAPGMRHVWLTEFGYETNPPDPRTAFTLQDQMPRGAGAPLRARPAAGPGQVRDAPVACGARAVVALHREHAGKDRDRGAGVRSGPGRGVPALGARTVREAHAVPLSVSYRRRPLRDAPDRRRDSVADRRSVGDRA